MDKNKDLDLVKSKLTEYCDHFLGETLEDFDRWMDGEVFDQVQYFAAFNSDFFCHLMEEHDIFIRSTGWEFYVCPKAELEE